MSEEKSVEDIQRDIDAKRARDARQRDRKKTESQVKIAAASELIAAAIGLIANVVDQKATRSEYRREKRRKVVVKIAELIAKEYGDTE